MRAVLLSEGHRLPEPQHRPVRLPGWDDSLRHRVLHEGDRVRQPLELDLRRLNRGVSSGDTVWEYLLSPGADLLRGHLRHLPDRQMRGHIL